MKISTRDRERMKHINSIMTPLHNANNQIYEHLVDEEFDLLKTQIKTTIAQLYNLLESIEEDV